MPTALDQTIHFILSGEQLQQSCSAPVHTAKESVCGYEWYVECRKSEQQSERELLLLAVPCDDCDAFELLVDYEMTACVDNVRARLVVDCEIINSRYISEEGCSPVLRVSGICCTLEETKDCSLSVRIVVRELLTVRRDDLTVETDQDNFMFLAATKVFYVNLRYLASFGSIKFSDLLERSKRGLRRIVVLSASPEELDIFLSALCRYGRPVITSRNWSTVLSLSLEFGVDNLVRLCEAFLINAKGIHVVRKLEYSLEYKLPYLTSTVVRQIQNDELSALELLHQYLESSSEELSQMDPAVLKAFGVFDDYVLL